jgi:pimeloyl-ACP methyl ester carboxylesterase
MHTSRRTSRRIAGIVAGIVAVAIALSGCSTWFDSVGSTGTIATSTPVVEDVAPALQPYYSQVLDWTNCGGGMQCTTAKAPLDWNDPARSTVELALVKQPATGGGARLGSLLVNPGGPGGSGYEFIKDSVDFATSEALQAQYDVVGFDPRGVGRSTAVKCGTSAQLDSYNFGIPSGARGSDEWLSGFTTLSTDFANQCAQSSGELLKYVDTVSAAHDLDLLRAILGDSKLNYFGYSYGTFLGSTYADLYPTKVGRVVLDGALDPTSSGFDVSVGQAVGFEGEIKAYLKACLSGPSDCPFSGSVDDGVAKIAQLLAQVDKSPIRANDGRELGSASLITAIVYPLYSPSSWSALSDMFSSVMDGKADKAMQLADGYYGRNPDGSYSDNSTEAFVAINCLDYPYTTDPAVIAQQNADLIAAAPTIGPYWTYGDIGCSVWPDKSTRTPHPVTAEGAPPIVVVGTTGDPATPYKWAQSLAGQLSSGRLVTFVGDGHTAYGSSSCVQGVVDKFLLTGDAPSSDPRCTQ